MVSAKSRRSDFDAGREQSNPQKPGGCVQHPDSLMLTKARVGHAIFWSLLICVISAPMVRIHAQTGLPFEISNPKNKKWEAGEAVRIYSWACELLARSIRPEKPPQLRPSFRLVLGAQHDEFVHDNAVFEIRLKSWNSEKFSEGVVLAALRGVVQADELSRVAHESVALANSTLDTRQLQHH